ADFVGSLALGLEPRRLGLGVGALACRAVVGHPLLFDRTQLVQRGQRGLLALQCLHVGMTRWRVVGFAAFGAQSRCDRSRVISPSGHTSSSRRRWSTRSLAFAASTSTPRSGSTLMCDAM